MTTVRSRQRRTAVTVTNVVVDVIDWQEFPWEQHEPDPTRDRLCVGRTSPTQIDCRIEGASFTTAPATTPTGHAPEEVVIWAYNIERGLRLDEQLSALGTAAHPPDVLLLSEADRGCSRTGGRNVAREYARALGMYYVYGVEFVELARLWGPGGGRINQQCEHGNAIISRYPLGNVRVIRHQKTRSWHSRSQRLLHIGQPRLGGRVAIAADVRIGERFVRVYSVHFESGRHSTGPQSRDGYRLAQAGDIIDDAADVPHGVVIGGDMNVVGFLDSLRSRAANAPAPEPTAPEPTTAALAAAGYTDAHAALAASDRITTDSNLCIDLIVGRGVTFVDAGVGDRPTWGALSDHLPVWTRLRL